MVFSRRQERKKEAGINERAKKCVIIVITAYILHFESRFRYFV